ncbi:MAG: hypothetical protein HY878_01920 [Deltaproteobacteria bacterium]|nr:hypothetical protein [Deltaproteobacteria bacterium]
MVTVKAYPNPSRKYGETVCVAGIELTNKKWIRLYPIPYRDLDNDKKFKKYNVIEVKATKALDDKRPESFKVDINSIRIIDWYDTKNHWKKRKKLLFPTLSSSLCEIYEESESNGKSLGMFKPQNVEFNYQYAKPKDEDARGACYAQLSFYNKNKDVIEPIPYEFRYSFNCDGKVDCGGHSLPIIDWEIGQSYRSWRWKYRGEGVLLEKIKERWLDNMCSYKKDTYFFVGNWKRFRDNFMILGVFYPPKV